MCWPLDKKMNNTQGKETVSTRLFLCGSQREEDDVERLKAEYLEYNYWDLE